MPDPTQATATLIARDRAHLWHPYTQHGTERDPLPVSGAEGSTLTLTDGRVLVDGISSWWATLHGHGHPRIVQALVDQSERLDHVLFAGTTHEPAVRLAEQLVRRTPGDLTRVFYSDDGSTAVEVALKIARQLWVRRGEDQRRTFVALEGGYHGDTFGAMAVGDPDPFFTAFTPLLFDAVRVPVEEGAVGRALELLGDRVAGVIVEPLIQGAAGMRMHGAGLLRDVRATCDRAGVPLIADEVMTGFGRTGRTFACEAAGIEPDILCLAKGLTGGTFPLSATLVREEIFAAFLSEDRTHAFFHGHTFTASPLGCAVALASLEVLDEEDTPAALTRVGAHILAGCAPLEEMEGVTNLRSLGGVVAYDLVVPGEGYLAAVAPRLRARAIELGVLLRPLGNVVYAMPPSCTDDAQCERIAEVMVELARTARGSA